MRQYIDSYTSIYHRDNEDLVLYNCGTEACPAGYYFGPFTRDFNLIHFVVRGEGVLTIDNVEYPVKRNQAFFMPANKVSKYQADINDPWEYYWIGFMGINASGYMFNILHNKENPYVLDIENIAYFAEIIGKMIEVGESGVNLRNHLILQGYMYHLLAPLIPLEESVEHVSVEDYVFQAQNYMKKNYGNHQLQIEGVAKMLGLHPNYFTTIFKHAMGFTPKEYLIELRMAKATDFLLNTNYRIKIIAPSVGYSDPLAFSRAFKNHFQVSPKMYRNLFQK